MDILTWSKSGMPFKPRAPGNRKNKSTDESKANLGGAGRNMKKKGGRGGRGGRGRDSRAGRGSRGGSGGRGDMRGNRRDNDKPKFSSSDGNEAITSTDLEVHKMLLDQGKRMSAYRISELMGKDVLPS